MLIKTLKTIMTTDEAGKRITIKSGEIINMRDDNANKLIKKQAAAGVESQFNMSIKPEKLGA